jgi:hypothetical protein
MQEKKMALEGAAIKPIASKLGAILGLIIFITGTVSEFGMNNFNVGGVAADSMVLAGGVKTQNARS